MYCYQDFFLLLQLLSELNPRLVVDGHTHHGCHTIHRGKIPEWTIASFNWRNKINPTFALVSVLEKLVFHVIFIIRDMILSLYREIS